MTVRHVFWGGLLGGLLILGGDGRAASVPPEALDTIRRLAVQHNGRIKPFDSFAREMLQLISGSPQLKRPPTASFGTSLGDPTPRRWVWGARLGREDSVATVLAIMAEPERRQSQPLVAIPFGPLREALGLRPKATHVSYDELIATRTLMRMLPPIVEKQERDEKLTILENETMDAFQRFAALSSLLEQRLHLIPPPGAANAVWLPVLGPAGYSASQQSAIRSAWTDLIASVRSGQGDTITASARRAAAVLRGLRPAAYPASWRLELEVLYNHVAPFHVARWAYLAAALGLLVGIGSSTSRWGSVGLGALWGAFVLHGIGIAMRVILGGRPPVSNFFETTLWLPFVAVALALIFERVYRVRYFGLAAAILAAIMLVLADFLPLDPSISPVVAVLRSNLWLTIHVLTIVASYGALALATVLAHVYGWLYLVRRLPVTSLEPRTLNLELFLYRAIQVGVVLLAGGIMLGAVWANASWGRYWGWDPKETWALITLLWFLAVLHGRFAGWLRGVGFALSTIGGFFLLLMTYYGVSFYLVGLHSYAGGHAKPLPLLLIAYLVVELAFMAWVGLVALGRPPAAPFDTSLADPAAVVVPRLGRPPAAPFDTSLADPAAVVVPRLGRKPRPS